MTLLQYQTWLSSYDKNRCVLLILKGYSLTSQTEDSFYISNRNYITEPTDTPANTTFIPKLLNAGLEFTREIGFLDSPRGDSSYGNLTIDNTDGSLDNWINYSFAGREIKILIGDPSWPYTDFNLQPFLIGTIENVEFSDFYTFSITIRDKIGLLDKALNSNVLTSGPKKNEPTPLAFGYLRNIEPILTVENALTYKFNDGAVQSVADVYDNGVTLTPTSGYTTDLVNGTITLVNSPVGTITMDVQGMKYSGVFLNTPSLLVNHILTVWGGLTSNDINATSLNNLPSYPIGLYLTQRENILDVLDKIFEGLGCAYFFNFDGKFTVVRIASPANPSDVIYDYKRVRDTLQIKALPPPYWRYRLGYEKNNTVQEADRLAGSVANANAPDKTRLGWLGNEFRTITVSDNAVKTAYLNSVDGEQVESVIDSYLMNLTCTAINFVSGSSVDFTFSGSPDLSSIQVGDGLKIFRGCITKNRGTWPITSIDNVNKKLRADVYASSAANNQPVVTCSVEILTPRYANTEAGLRFTILKSQRYLCTFSTPVFSGLPGDVIQIVANRYGLTGKNIQILKANIKDGLTEIEGWF